LSGSGKEVLSKEQAVLFDGSRGQPAEGDKSVDKGIYSKLPEKRRGKKEGFSHSLCFFFEPHLCSPSIYTLKREKKLHV